MERFFSPNFGEDQCLDAHHSQISWGGNADEDHTQIIGGDTVKLLRGIYPPPPPPRASAPLYLRLLIKGLIVPIRPCILSITYY